MHDVLPLLACNTNGSKEPLTLPDLHQRQGVLPLVTLQGKRVVCYHATHARRTDTHEHTGALAHTHARHMCMHTHYTQTTHTHTHAHKHANNGSNTSTQYTQVYTDSSLDRVRREVFHKMREDWLLCQH